MACGIDCESGGVDCGLWEGFSVGEPGYGLARPL